MDFLSNKKTKWKHQMQNFTKMKNKSSKKIWKMEFLNIEFDTWNVHKVKPYFHS